MIYFLGLLSLFFSALFSGSEIAYISANKLKVQLKTEKGRRGKLLSKFYKNPSQFITIMLIGNSISLVLFTFIMTQILSPFFVSFSDSSFLRLLIETIIITLIVLVFGEFLPKSIFKIYAEELLYILAFPLQWIRLILKGPAIIISGISNFIWKRILKKPIIKEDYNFTHSDLKSYIEKANVEEDVVDTDLLERAIEFKDVKARECMVPRNEITAIDINDSIDDLVKAFRENHFSRIIIYDGDIDNILGYVHHQQLLEKGKTIKKMMMAIPIIPETTPADKLLSDFSKNSYSIACVVDEFGSTAGIVTIEDILEEIFGEIEDEHDSEDYIEEDLKNNKYLFSGRLEIDYLNEKYENIELPEGEYHTLSGLIVSQTSDIPEKNDIIKIDNYSFLVKEESDKRIELIELTILEKEDKQ